MIAGGIVVTRASAMHLEGLGTFFRRNHNSCFCRFFQFEGTNSEWLARCAEEPDRNMRELQSAMRSPEHNEIGIVGSREGTVVGWLKLSRSLATPKLYAQRHYRSLPCFGGPRDQVFAISCLLVDEPLRRQGIATALIEHAVVIATELGASAIEAFPRRSAEPISDAERFAGPIDAYLRNGFEVINDFGPYPVLKKTFHG